VSDVTSSAIDPRTPPPAARPRAAGGFVRAAGSLVAAHGRLVAARGVLVARRRGRGAPAAKLPSGIDTGMDTPFTLDAPLPAELAGRSQGWLTRYRRFPVFSPPWTRGRLRTLGPIALGTLLVAALPLAVPRPDTVPLGGLLQLTVQLLLPLVLGPALCTWVRRQGWDDKREWAALVGALVLVVLTLFAFHNLLAEPMKQKVAEWMGQVDAEGKRKKVQVAIGVSITSPDDPASSPARAGAPGEVPPSVHLMNTLSSGALTFFLGGGAGLFAWRRERAGLAALARERELARAQAERREAELRLSVLAAQVEPHFLFNTLAGVRSAIATQPARAAEMIDRLVDYLRASIPRLRSDGGAAATLGGQLDIVRAYLALMALRMPRLAFDIRAPEALLAAPFPPLMLISLAENAVKHGAEPKIGPVRIELDAARLEDGRLEVSVADDGAGFGGGGAGGGLGLANIRERLAQMYGPRAALTLRERPGGGVVASIIVPTE